MEPRAKNEYDSATYIYWKTQISAALSWRDKFDKRGEKIIERYRDEDKLDIDRRYNILYANTETLQPVVYSSKPRADVLATNPKSIANRKGAELIEMGINYYIDNDDFDEKARTAVTDFLLPGMGQIRPKYNAVRIEEEIPVDVLTLTTEDKVIEKDGESYIVQERVVFESISYEYVHWKDFIYPESATWSEVPWVAFRSKFTFDEAVELFGEEKANMLKYEPYYTDRKDKKDEGVKKAVVYEIWDKLFREQLFYAESGNGKVLDINDDPLELEEFFPVPKPLLSITTSGTLLPVPFFKMYEDQALELNAINSRIYAMIDNMRRRGFYDASLDALGNISSMGDNMFWPIKDWTNFAGKGGLSGAMQVEDISTYANILGVLKEARRETLEDIYQIIGISDIRRGQTDPRETLGAQKMKGRYGTIRISTYQRKVAEFMRDLLRITGEIIVNQFEPETVALITNKPLKSKVTQSPEGPIVEEVGVEDLLLDLKSRAPINIKIDIETDSTILEDIEEDRQGMTEAVATLAEFTNIAPNLLSTLGPEATATVLMEIIYKFKLGRDIQQQVEDYIDQLKKNPPPPQPSEAEILAQAEVKKKEIESQTEMAKLQIQQEKNRIDAVVSRATLSLKQQDLMLRAEELDIRAVVEKQKIDLGAIDRIIQVEALKIENKNMNDNAVVGV